MKTAVGAALQQGKSCDGGTSAAGARGLLLGRRPRGTALTCYEVMMVCGPAMFSIEGKP